MNLHRVRVDLFDLRDLLVEAQVGEIRELHRIRFVERLVRVEHPLESEDDVIRVEFARRLEVRRGLELHAVAQMERVGQAVRRDIPLFARPGSSIGAAVRELDERL